jgi:squalene synthase HpnD
MGALSDFNDRIADVQANEHVRAVTKRSGSSFYWAMRRLEFARRDAMYAIYAFCREVDDIADEQAPSNVKIEGLQVYRQEIVRVYGDGATTMTGRALQHVIDVYDLDKRDMDAVIEGMLTDAEPTVCMADMDELHLYMDRVACAVGRMSNQIFGISEPARTNLAKVLGEALQLTNILRDLDEDAARGRMYLPVTLLRKHGIQVDEPAAILDHEALSYVCNELSDLAATQFSTARAMLDDVDAKQGRPAVMMMEAYRLIHEKLRKRGWSTPRATVSPTMLERLGMIIRYGL